MHKFSRSKVGVNELTYHDKVNIEEGSSSSSEISAISKQSPGTNSDDNED